MTRTEFQNCCKKAYITIPKNNTFFLKYLQYYFYNIHNKYFLVRLSRKLTITKKLNTIYIH